MVENLRITVVQNKKKEFSVHFKKFLLLRLFAKRRRVTVDRARSDGYDDEKVSSPAELPGPGRGNTRRGVVAELVSTLIQTDCDIMA